VLVPRPDALRPDVRNFFKGEGKGGEYIAFPRGVGQTLGNDSPLLTPVLRAPRSAYSYNPKDDVEGVEDPFAVGQQLSLVSVMQARNSARFTVIGAAEMLEDKWFDAKVKPSVGMQGVNENAKGVKSSNRAFAKEISGWTFNEIGVMKVGRIEHYLSEDSSQLFDANVANPKIYRVKNTVASRTDALTRELISNKKFRHTQLSYRNTHGINLFHSRPRQATTSSLSSPCSHPSIVFHWPLQFLPRILPSTPHLSRSLTNTVSSTSWSSTGDPSYQMSRRKILSLCDTLRTMSGHGAGRSVEHGLGLLALQLL
jgi:hypothetical protein